MDCRAKEPSSCRILPFRSFRVIRVKTNFLFEHSGLGGVMRKDFPVAVLSLLLVGIACAGNETGGNRRDTMTQRQRDSVLGQSGIPGAGGVTKAMIAADSAKARQARLDSASRP